MLIEGHQDGVEGIVFLDLAHWKLFEQLPCCTCERAEDVEDGFCLSLGNCHLVVIQGDTFPPFFVVGGLATECWDEGIP